MQDKLVENKIQINASVSDVWNLLTKPELTKKYMFGCETVTDWNAGSSLLWQAEFNGVPTVFVKGFIKEISAPKKLHYTVIDPNAEMEDIEENYLHVVYLLNATMNGSELIVQQFGFENAADGEKRYLDVYNNGEGWNPILVQIKALAETSVKNH